MVEETKGEIASLTYIKQEQSNDRFTYFSKIFK